MSQITNLHIFNTKSKISKPISDATHTISDINFIVVELELANGIIGQGYLLSFHYSPNAILGSLKDIKGLVLGLECYETGKLWNLWQQESEYFGNNGLQKWAYSIVNIAMWDAWAKTLNKPIHQLFGIYHDKIPVYGSGGWLSYSEQELIDEVLDYKKRGFTAVKIKVGSPTIEEDLYRLRKVRETVGPELNIMMDANQGMDVPSALLLSKKASEIGIYWFEEPISNTDYKGYQMLRNKTDISLAMGEREYNTEALNHLITMNAIDLWQPDIIRLGGVEAWRDSVALAQANHIPILPHYYKDYDVPLLCTTNNIYGAESFDWIDDIIDNKMTILDGYAYPRNTPGWGFNFLHQYMTEC